MAEPETHTTERERLVAVIANDVRANGLGPDLPRWSTRIADVIQREYVIPQIAEALRVASEDGHIAFVRNVPELRRYPVLDARWLRDRADLIEINGRRSRDGM